MDIAAMNVRITFQKNGVIVDKIGNHTNDWSDFYSCFATVSDSAGKSSAEDTAAGLIIDHSDISFTERFCKKAMAISSINFRILWNGEAYNIVKIDHLNLKKRALKLKSVKERS